MGTNNNIETKVGGLRAVELYYRGIREFESGDTTFLQSKTRLNTPGMGTLMPETFRKVAELSNQCVSLFELELKQCIETVKSLLEKDFYFRWISVYMPLRYLETKNVQQKLMDTMDEMSTDTNRICFEVAPELLLHGTNVHRNVIEQLRNRGFHFMLTDFGGINSPLMKLAYFPVDYVMLSQEIIGYLNKDDRSLSAVSSIVDFVEGMEADVIADGVSNVDQAEQLFKSHIRFGAGSLVGRYVTERYLKRKKSEENAAAKNEESYESSDHTAEVSAKTAEASAETAVASTETAEANTVTVEANADVSETSEAQAEVTEDNVVVETQADN